MRRCDYSLLLVVLVIGAIACLAYVGGFALLRYAASLDGSEGHFDYLRYGDWILVRFWDNIPGPGQWRGSLIVCQDVPASVDLSGAILGHAERTDGVGPWRTFEVEGQPTMKVTWGHKVRWKWGDAAAIETRVLTDEELQTVIASDHWDEENGPDLLRMFVGRAASSRPAAEVGVLIK